MPLFDVNVSLLLDAADEDQAYRKATSLLDYRAIDKHCTIMIHKAELDDSFENLADLRDARDGEQTSDPQAKPSSARLRC